MLRLIAGLSVVVFALSFLAAADPTNADEVYLPRGHAYGPDFDVLPPLNSSSDRINAMADIREAELRREQRDQRIFQEQFDMFIDLNLSRPGRGYSPY